MAGEHATSLLAQYIASEEEPSGDVEGKSFPSYPYNTWHPALLRPHPQDSLQIWGPQHREDLE